MLLMDLSKEFISLDEYRIIAEIFLDRMGHAEASRSIENMSIAKMKLDSNKPITSLVNFIGEKFDLSSDELDTLLQRINEYLLNNDRSDLLYNYVFTNKILKMLGEQTKYNADSIFDPNSVVSQFAEETRKYYTSGYSIGSGAPIAYLTSAYKHFYVKNREKSDAIYAEINARGTSIELDEGNVSISDIMYIEIDNPEAMDFRKIATTIYNSSEVFYSTTEKGSPTPTVYYDLFSRYKYKKIEECYKKIDRAFEKSFGQRTSMPDIDVGDINYIPGNQDYRENTKRVRDKMASLLDPYLGHCIPPSRLSSLYAEIKRMDENRSNVKNSSSLFKGGTSSGKVLSNIDKFNMIIYGFSTVSYFIKYLHKVDISPFDVPSKIFQDASYIKRFKTLQEYLLVHARTEELIESSSRIVESVPTNDELYDNLSGSLKNRLTSYRFSSIKDIIDGNAGLGTIKEPDAYLNYNLIRATLSKVKLSMEGVYENGKLIKRGTEMKLKLMYSICEKLNSIGWTGYKLNSTGDYTVSYKDAPIPDNAKQIYDIISELMSTSVDDDYDIHLHFPDNQLVLYILRYLNLKMGVLKAIQDLATRLLDVTNYLQFLDLLEKQPRLFDIPLTYSNPNSINRILSEYRVPLFLQEDDDIFNYSEVYRLMYAFSIEPFEQFLKYVQSHKAELYEDLAKNYICKTNMFRITSNRLKDISTSLLYIPDHKTEKFSIFKSLCDVGDYEYLYREGRPYTEIVGGNVRYLHSRGYWVYLNEDLGFEKVAESDSFGGE